MKRKYRILMLGVLIFSSGCNPFKPYTPAEIRSEYADVFSIQGQSASGVSENHLPASLLACDRTEAVSGKALDLAEVIAVAIANNPNIEQALHRMAQAKAMKDLADTAFWPSAGIYTEYMQGDAPSAYLFKTIDGRKLPPGTDFNDPGWFENYETGVNARINIFKGGRDYLGCRIAEQDVRISALDRQAVINDMTARVIAAFFDVLAAREFVEIAEESFESVAEQLRIIQVRYAGGGVLKSDVLTLEVRLALANESVVQSRNRFKLAKAILGNLMGVDPGEFLQIQLLFADSDPRFIDVPETYEEGIVYALSHRPELEKTRNQLIKSRMELDVARSGYLPSLDLMARYYVDDPQLEYDRGRENWTAAVTMNWDLFTVGRSQYHVDRAEAIIREMLGAGRQATLDIKLDVKSAYLNREAARARYEAAESSVKSAEESYRLVQAHYKGGLVTITRYLEAELDRNMSRIRTTAAYYDKIKATADLARALGKWAGETP